MIITSLMNLHASPSSARPCCAWWITHKYNWLLLLLQIELNYILMMPSILKAAFWLRSNSVHALKVILTNPSPSWQDPFPSWQGPFPSLLHVFHLQWQIISEFAQSLFACCSFLSFMILICSPFPFPMSAAKDMTTSVVPDLTPLALVIMRLLMMAFSSNKKVGREGWFALLSMPMMVQ